MPNKHKIHKQEDWISIVITVLFILGFLILANYETAITGYAVKNISISEEFGIEAISSYGAGFIFENSTNNEVAVFYETGRLTLAGSCISGGSCDSPPPNSFIIQNSSGDNSSYISPNGTLCLETGDCSDESASCTPPDGSFIIQNGTGSNVSYIDSTGDLCLTGKLIEGYSAGMIINNIFPENNSLMATTYINFTYDVVTDQDSIKNCSLWLYKSSSWELNETNQTAITQNINQSINITLEEGDYLWKIGCYDNTDNQGNSSVYNLTVDIENAPVIITENTTTPGVSSITLDDFVNVTFQFIACDQDGPDDLDNAYANITGEDDAGLVYYHNTVCYNTTWSNATCKEYNCSFKHWYWYKAGGYQFAFNVTDGTEFAHDNSSNYTMGSTTGIVIWPTYISWATLNIGDTNKTPDNDPININNTGNKNVTLNHVNVTAYDLHGEITSSQEIGTGNFSVDIVSIGACSGAACIECDGNRLVNETTQNITGSMLPRGNHSLGIENGYSGFENITFCLARVPPELAPQAYSTKNSAQWNIEVV